MIFWCSFGRNALDRGFCLKVFHDRRHANTSSRVEVRKVAFFCTSGEMNTKSCTEIDMVTFVNGDTFSTSAKKLYFSHLC